MHKKYKTIKTLAAFTILSGSFIPLYSHAQYKPIPTIELNFDVLEKLKESKESKSKVSKNSKASKEKKKDKKAKAHKPKHAEKKVVKKAPNHSAEKDIKAKDKSAVNEQNIEKSAKPAPKKENTIIKKIVEPELPPELPNNQEKVKTPKEENSTQNIYDDSHKEEFLNEKKGLEPEVSEKKNPVIKKEAEIKPVNTKPKTKENKTVNKDTKSAKEDIKISKKSAADLPLIIVNQDEPNSEDKDKVKTKSDTDLPLIIVNQPSNKNTENEEVINNEEKLKTENADKKIPSLKEESKKTEYKAVDKKTESKPDEISGDEKNIAQIRKVITEDEVNKKEPENTKQNKTESPAKDKIATPEITNKEKSVLSELMGSLPSFKKKTEIAKEPAEKSAPPIPEIKDIPAPTVKDPIAKEEEVHADNKGSKTVSIDQNTEKKLGDTIDRNISSNNSQGDVPPVPEPAVIPIEPEHNEHNKISEAKNYKIDEVIQKPEKQKESKTKNILLSIAFDGNNVTLSNNDKERITKLVKEMLNSTQRLKIMSYASGINGEVNSSRRISLQRAIAIRSQMILSGLEKTRINVQAAGNNLNDNEFSNSANIFIVE